MADVKVLQNNSQFVVRVELPDVRKDAMLTVVKATFKDGVLEATLEPARQEVAAPAAGADAPSKIFPE
jgi:HSP20 family molecular chaperone IbpA